MNKPKESARVSDKNYTPEMVQAIEDNSPMNFEQAGELGATFDPPKSAKSVVSKIKSLKLDYIPKPPPAKKPDRLTKLDMVHLISAHVDRDLTGLEKANMSSLRMLFNGIQHLETAE